MSQDQMEQILIKSLGKLEKASERLLKTRGYVDEVSKIKALEELIKEQLRNENTRRSTRQIR